MLRAYRGESGEELFHPDGMITGDGCDFPKKGRHSVGVQRQYCGRLGKTDNCRASVMVGYAQVAMDDENLIERHYLELPKVDLIDKSSNQWVWGKILSSDSEEELDMLAQINQVSCLVQFNPF